MYTREHFSVPMDTMVDFVRAKSFGVLATCHDGEVFTSPLPVDLRGDGDDLFVAGHVARANAMSAVFDARPPATITVLGPDTYVPAEWFGTRSRIPTWLYCAVEISGRLAPSGPEITQADTKVLIDRLQKDTVDGSTWTLDEIPRNLTDGYFRNIVGFRMYAPRFTSCFRLNQRKGESDSLAEALTTSDVAARRELAGLVRQASRPVQEPR